MLDMLSIRATLAASYDLAPNAELAEATRDIYAKMERVVPFADWVRYAPYVVAINALKKQRNAAILAHNYMTPEIYHGVADVVGDSLQLAIEATRVEADVIVQCGVHFMAETSKILSPEKTVLIPDLRAGCSLASSITGADVRLTIDADVHLVTENQSVYIPLGAKHRMENPGKVPMVLIEVQTGTYLGEDDITRYEDVYARGQGAKG